MRTDGHDEDSQVSIDELFRALAHPTRRWILGRLTEENPLDVFECDRAERHGGTGEPEPAAVALYHRHLPTLDEAGFIDRDDATGSITRGRRFEEIRPVLVLLEDRREELPDG